MVYIAIVEYPYVTGQTRAVVQVPDHAAPGDIVRFKDFDKFRFGEVISIAEVSDTDPVLEMFDTVAHGGKVPQTTGVFRLLGAAMSEQELLSIEGEEV